jgi:hypothetical protein
VLVTRDELLDAIWPDVAVTPDTLNKSIGELRLALGDDSRTPRFLETVHRRGFRFIASRAAADEPAPTPRAAAAQGLVPAADVREKAPACFVGRDAEMRSLADRFAGAQAGERQIVFVTGSAGAGKTALVDAFSPRGDRRARRAGVDRTRRVRRAARPAGAVHARARRCNASCARRTWSA